MLPTLFYYNTMLSLLLHSILPSLHWWHQSQFIL